MNRLVFICSSLLLCLSMAASETENSTTEEAFNSTPYHECIHDQLEQFQGEKHYTVVEKHPNLYGVDRTSDARRAQPLAFGMRNIKFQLVYVEAGSCLKKGDKVPALTSTAIIECRKEDVLTRRKNISLFEAIDMATELLSSMLTVTPTASINVDPSKCFNERIQTGLEKFVSNDYDFVVFVTANPMADPESSTLAWAGSCDYDSVAPNRPVVGLVNIVPSRLQGVPSKLQSRIVAHELSHALGFGGLPNHRTYLGGEQYEWGSTLVNRPDQGRSGVRVINSPKVLEVARERYGCPTLDGVEVEMNGGSGTAASHWKGRILLQEALVGVVATAALFYSSLTLALFDDKGYYTPIYENAEDDFAFGYKKGCDFLYKTCKANTDSGVANEYCFVDDKKTTKKCTFDRQGIGRCNVKKYDSDLPSEYRYMSSANLGGSMVTMDYCPVVSTYESTSCLGDSSALQNFQGHEFTPYSRCFESSLMTNGYPNTGEGARCIPTACGVNGRLYLRVQGQTVTCPENGEEGYAEASHLLSVEGKIKCPKASEICWGRVYTGMATPPTPVSTPMVTHSTVNFSEVDTVQGTCAERVEKCKQIVELYPLCDFFTKRLQQCMSRDCPQEVSMLIRDSISKDVRTRCRSNLKEQADICLDSWSGALSLCALVDAAHMLTYTAPLITLFVTLAVALVG